MTPNELVLTFGGLHVCVQFGENRRRNATGRVSTDGHTHTHAQTQNDFIICPMLYAIAMGQIKINQNENHTALNESSINWESWSTGAYVGAPTRHVAAVGLPDRLLHSYIMQTLPVVSVFDLLLTIS